MQENKADQNLGFENAENAKWDSENVYLNDFDLEYTNLIDCILHYGATKDNRTGIKTKSIFGVDISYNFLDNDFRFPVTTLRKFAIKSMAVELEGFLKGITDKTWYQSKKCTIWNEWARPDQSLALGLKPGTEEYKRHQLENPDLGPIYGWQLRHFGGDYIDHKTNYDGVGYDQLMQILNMLENDPDSRRMFVSYYNPTQVHMQALPPCHYSWQVNTELAEDGISRYIDISFTMRSCDVMLGLPFNVAHYALLLLLLANQFNYIPRQVIGHLGDAHIYYNHFEQAKEILRRSESKPMYELPFLEIDKNNNTVLTFDANAVRLVGYQSWPALSMEVAV